MTEDLINEQQVCQFEVKCEEQKNKTSVKR